MHTSAPIVSTTAELAELARLRWCIQQDLRRLGLRSDAAAARLRELVAVGDVREAGGFVIRIAPPPRVLDVVDPSLVPQAFLSLQPDLDALRRRWLATGDAPPGCQPQERRPAVYVVRGRMPLATLQ
jgi:hypothetical protein